MEEEDDVQKKTSNNISWTDWRKWKMDLLKMVIQIGLGVLFTIFIINSLDDNRQEKRFIKQSIFEKRSQVLKEFRIASQNFHSLVGLMSGFNTGSTGGSGEAMDYNPNFKGNLDELKIVRNNLNNTRKSINTLIGDIKLWYCNDSKYYKGISNLQSRLDKYENAVAGTRELAEAKIDIEQIRAKGTKVTIVGGTEEPEKRFDNFRESINNSRKEILKILEDNILTFEEK